MADIKENAVLGDKALQDALTGINPVWGELCIRVAGEVWGKPLIDQKTKAFICIAIDIANQHLTGPGQPFEAHMDMALKQGATKKEIEELFLFLTAYLGFNKVAGAFGALNNIIERGKTGLGTEIT